jgi:hypothetical protein
MKIISFLLISAYALNFASAQEKVPYAWIAGEWIGDGFGGSSEEVWSQPSMDGTIMGTYRHHTSDGTINFYEFFLLDSTGLNLRHFNPDMTAWEGKEEFLHFKLIEFTKNKIILKGLVYELTAPDEMKIYLDMKDEDGNVRTEVFSMKRK